MCTHSPSEHLLFLLREPWRALVAPAAFVGELWSGRRLRCDLNSPRRSPTLIGVGKTCLLLRYANDSFSPTFITTIGKHLVSLGMVAASGARRGRPFNL